MPREVVPDAADDDDDGSSSRAIVDAACTWPASVLPAASAVEPRAAGPAVSIVAIAVSTLDMPVVANML